MRPAEILARTNLAFCAFVLSLGVVVLALREHGLGRLIAVESSPGLLLAALIGPNLTYVGSLVTLCGGSSCGSALGALTVPPALVAGVAAL